MSDCKSTHEEGNVCPLCGAYKPVIRDGILIGHVYAHTHCRETNCVCKCNVCAKEAKS